MILASELLLRTQQHGQGCDACQLIDKVVQAFYKEFSFKDTLHLSRRHESAIWPAIIDIHINDNRFDALEMFVEDGMPFNLSFRC